METALLREPPSIVIALSGSLEPVSFGIITDGRRPDKLERLLGSIRRLRELEFEIIIAGQIEPLEGIRCVPMPEAARTGRVSALRNAVGARARHQYVAFCDDDIVLSPGWGEGLVGYLDRYDLIATRLINPDGTRHWDWSTFGGARGHIMLEYGEKDDQLYLTSGLMLVRKAVWAAVGWNPKLVYKQAEDVDFSQRVMQTGYTVGCCTASWAVHNDEYYTQVGRCVERRSRSGKNRWSSGALREMSEAELTKIGHRCARRRLVADATDCFRAYLKRDPGNQRALRALSRIALLRGGMSPGDEANWQFDSVLRGL